MVTFTSGLISSSRLLPDFGSTLTEEKKKVNVNEASSCPREVSGNTNVTENQNTITEGMMRCICSWC